jgi:uncharacterized damage-inducible protein DinB
MSRANSTQTSEAARIADQLRRAFDGSAWHGPALLELLENVDAATAAAKPLRNVHSIWELVLHITAWDGVVLCRLGGGKMRLSAAKNFPRISNPTEAGWDYALATMKRVHNVLVTAVESLPDARLRERVPGKRYDFYHMLHGVVQHELYHAGQIAILKKVRSQKKG